MSTTSDPIADFLARLKNACRAGQDTCLIPYSKVKEEIARILKEEVFGPVAPVTGFDTEDEAIAAANDTEYGLAAYIYTQSLDRALRVSEALESGMVCVNSGILSNEVAPFGGVKQSGLGREIGRFGLDEFMEIKSLVMRIGRTRAPWVSAG